PILPGLNLPASSFLPTGAHLAPATQTIQPLETQRQRAIREAKQKIDREDALRRISFSTSKAALAPAGTPLTFGFYVNDDEASFSSLKQNLDTPEVSIDVVIGVFLHLQDASGTLNEDDPEHTRILSDLVRTHRPQTKIMALVNNNF